MPTARRERSLRLLQTLIMAVGVVLAGRVFYVQVIRQSHYVWLADKYQPANRPRAGQPGAILDRNGNVLAYSVTAASVKVNPEIARRKEDTREMAEFLARTLALDVRTVEAKLTGGGDFAYIARHVDLPIASAALAGSYAGLGQDLEYRRYYPNGALASQVIGVCSADHRPLEGLERRFGFALQSREGTPVRNRDAFDRTIVGWEAEPCLPPADGLNLVTTLDLGLQRAVERELDRCWAEKKPKAISAVVLDCGNGEILAMANRPAFDPNSIAGAGSGAKRAPVPPKSMRNLTVFRQYEPGSTFKPLVVAAALDAGVIEPTDSFHCEGTTSIGGRTLSCWGEWARKGHGNLTPEGVIANSCNLGAARIAMKLGAERYCHFLKTVGIGQSTRSGIAGEAAGVLRDANSLRPRDLANMGFGHTVMVTDLQLAAAIGAVVNGGVYYWPHIAKALTSRDGAVCRQIEPIARRRVCSEKTSRIVGSMLVAAVERGTGRAARIDGAVVGGKTGTAQIWDPTLKAFNGYNMSFVLTAPMDSGARFVVLVSVQEPAIGQHAADVAAPYAREIGRYLLERPASATLAAAHSTSQ